MDPPPPHLRYMPFQIPPPSPRFSPVDLNRPRNREPFDPHHYYNNNNDNRHHHHHHHHHLPPPSPPNLFFPPHVLGGAHSHWNDASRPPPDWNPRSRLHLPEIPNNVRFEFDRRGDLQHRLNFRALGGELPPASPSSPAAPFFPVKSEGDSGNERPSRKNSVHERVFPNKATRSGALGRETQPGNPRFKKLKEGSSIKNTFTAAVRGETDTVLADQIPEKEKPAKFEVSVDQKAGPVTAKTPLSKKKANKKIKISSSSNSPKTPESMVIRVNTTDAKDATKEGILEKTEDSKTNVMVPSQSPKPKVNGLLVPSQSPKPKVNGVLVPSQSPKPKVNGVLVPSQSPKPKVNSVTVSSQLPNPKVNAVIVLSQSPKLKVNGVNSNPAFEKNVNNEGTVLNIGASPNKDLSSYRCSAKKSKVKGSVSPSSRHAKIIGVTSAEAEDVKHEELLELEKTFGSNDICSSLDQKPGKESSINFSVSSNLPSSGVIGVNGIDERNMKSKKVLEKKQGAGSMGLSVSETTGKEALSLEVEVGAVVDFHESSLKDDTVSMERGRDEVTGFDATEEEKSAHCAELHLLEQDKLGIFNLEVQNLVSDQRLLGETGGDRCDSVVNGESSMAMAVISTEEVTEFSADSNSGIHSPESSPTVQEVQIFSTDNSKLEDKLVDRYGSDSNSNNGVVSSPEVDFRSDVQSIIERVIRKKIHPLPIQTAKQPSLIPAATRPLLSSGTPTLLPKAGFSFGSLKAKATTPSTHITKRARTWTRTGNNDSSASPSPISESFLYAAQVRKESPKKIPKLQTSYIRKGNSLVRKASPMATFSMASASFGCTSVDKRNVTGPVTDGGSSIDRLKSPPLSSIPKLASSNSKGSKISAHAASTPIKLAENSSDDPTVVIDEKLKISTNSKGMTYVKHKSNQLVAASRPEVPHFIEGNTHKLPVGVSSDGFYKRKNNQIVRNTAGLETQIKQGVAVLEDNSNSEGQKAAPLVPSLKYNRSLSKRRLDKDLLKKRKASKFSLVWTPGAAHVRKGEMVSLPRRKALPYLFPWKRTTYLRCSMDNIASQSDNRSLSLIRKFHLLQKRDTVYTRSTSGFSLRRSRVLSINGCHLKWSKSIERHSKKASKEATLAVAAVEQKKREHKGPASIAVNIKNGNTSSRKLSHDIELQPGERIFRIGSVRYKMDASNRTLVRITDEKSSSATDIHSGNDTTKSFIPRRLLIGKDEYIRIGNGNKLVRDPKKLKRILASEKVRWSLHTARLRLAKKQQYCHFFTRFGKCSKEDGRCPYIHDPDKIAVCTKFLKGLCSSSDCKLTHKVIPERMQDCSYFLQGLCTNGDCPYRHVNVNPSASVCEGFLRGYCTDGDECRKKHTYVCRHFEEKGVCPLGPTCKLHHPKNIKKCRKRKRPGELKSGKGRYFGSYELFDCDESRLTASENESVEPTGGDIFFHDGQFTDYVGLDVHGGEFRKTEDPMHKLAILGDCEPSNLEVDNFDSLIKPVRLMKKRRIGATPANSS